MVLGIRTFNIGYGYTILAFRSDFRCTIALKFIWMVKENDYGKSRLFAAGI